MVKVNVDAHTATSYVGLGVVVRGEMGQILLTATRRIEVCWEVEVAEAAAASLGAQIARRYGFERVWIEGDALNVVRTIDTKMKGPSPLCLIYDDEMSYQSY